MSTRSTCASSKSVTCKIRDLRAFSHLVVSAIPPWRKRKETKTDQQRPYPRALKILASVVQFHSPAP